MDFKVLENDIAQLNRINPNANYTSRDRYYALYNSIYERLLKMEKDGEIVLENVFRYSTLSRSVRPNSVSSGLRDTENSDSKSSSMIYRPSAAQRRYSCRLDADAVTPLGKLR